ncbi:MAG: DNA repair protein RecO [Oscillospiraceae bacterium]|nr:DNA repair protein RecO [Oscillospiraceae bacterium]
MYLDADAIVLRETRYRDADKILTVLTRSDGLLTVAARGACRKNCPFSASAQLLAYSRLHLFRYRDRVTLNDAALVDAWMPLHGDLERLALGVYAAEVCQTLSPEGLVSAELFDLLRLTLYRLAYKPQSGTLVKAAFELAALRFGGFGPDAEAMPPLTPGGADALRYVLDADPARLFSFALEGEDLHSLARASEAYLLTQLERGFSSLDFYKEICT